MSPTLKRTLLVVAAALVVAQFVGPRRTNPASDPAKSLARKVPIPKDVDAILTRSCRNCHSNETAWPWYAYVAPASWAVINDVNTGREHMNLSEWTYSTEESADLLDNVCKQVRRGSMPVKSYTWIHRSAVLSDADKKRLCRWANDAADAIASGAPSTR